MCTADGGSTRALPTWHLVSGTVLLASNLLRSSSFLPDLFLVVACVAAVADWIAVSSSDSRRSQLELIAKPAVPLALIGVAATASCSVGGVRLALILALVGCLGGDVALMLPDPTGNRFLLGLGSFLAGQILFAVAFTLEPHGNFLTGLVVIALLFTAPLTVVLRHLSRSEPALLAPVVVYVLAIVIMAAFAVASGLQPGTGPKAALIGGIAFVLSDTLLAINRFVRPLPHSSLLVHATYHVAIVGLTIGLLTLA